VLRVTYRGDTVQVAFDGKIYIDARDSHITGPGKTGVWTKADSVTVFDDFNSSAAR
jgi:hypothetical protein